MSSYPLFHKRNLPAYFTVMLVWGVLSILSATILRWLVTGGITWCKATIWSGVTCMSGMGIMFGASVINLRKLGPGFRRLADGAEDPKISPVWCPVLTAATKAAIKLSSTQRKGDRA